MRAHKETVESIRKEFYTGVDENEHIRFLSKNVQGWKELIDELELVLNSKEPHSREWIQKKENDLHTYKWRLKEAQEELEKELSLRS